MASFRELRPNRRLARAGRSGLHGRRIALPTAAIALAAIALALLAQLAGRPEQRGNPSTSTPAFLTNALGTQQSSAQLVRKPRSGVSVRLRPGGYAVTRAGGSFSLTSTEAGGPLRAFRNGTIRDTEFGSETVTVSSVETEQFLTVERRQGPRTWTWNLVADGLDPKLRGDGAVAFSARGRDANLSLLPPRVLADDGRDVTPDGTAWRLERNAHGWRLALDLDDAELPLPYVIDPAANYPSPLNLRSTASAVTGSWRMDGSTGAVNIATNTVPAQNATGYYQFNPGVSNATAAAPGAATGRGWIVEPVGGASGFPAGTWTFTVQTDIPNTTLVAGTAILAIGIWKGTVSGATFTPTQTIMAVTDDPAAQDIRTSTSAVTTNVSYNVGQVSLGASETLYVEIWRRQTGGINATQAPRRQLDLYVNDGVTKIAHPAADDTAPTAAYSLTSQSPAGSTYRSGTTIYYRGTGGGSGGSFRIRNTVADGGSGPGSSTTQDTLASGGWTHTASTVSTPAGGPFDSNTLTWTEGSTSSPTERIYGSDLAGNASSTTTFTMTNDSTAPPAPASTFPVPSGAYRATTWNAGCGTNGFCGTAGADGASALREVVLSIQRSSNSLYWDGSGFNSASEVFLTATGTATWSYTFPATNFPADGNYVVRARSVDNVNNDATESAITFAYDTTAPAAPSSLGTTPASPANNNDPRVTGTAEAGSTVDVYATSDCSGGVAATGTAAAFGGAGLNPSDVADDSSTSYTAKATDAAGNVSGCSSAVTYVEDSAAPSAPSGLATNPASPANDNDPRITGTAEAGSTVTLYATADCTGGSVGSGSAATFGGAGLDPTNVADNSSTSYTATATDAAGNVSGCSSAVTYVEDSAAPSAPSGLATNPASPANDNDPRVTGTAEAGSTVSLYETSDCSGGVAASGSAATFGAAGLDPANVADNSTTSYTAKATDAAGNISACSSAVSYVEDSAAPSAPSGLGSAPASPANDNDPRLTGTAEAGSTVSLYATSDCSGGVAASGSAATFGAGGLNPANVADDSTTSYTARATDAAGNVSGCSSAYAYVEDSTAPSAPTSLGTTPSSPANDNDPRVTGTAEAGSTVTLYATADCTGGSVATGSAATFGGAGLDPANVADDSTTSYTARTTDAAGNQSGCSAAVSYVEDSTAPSTPSIDSSSPASPANDTSPELIGTAEAGSTVRLYTTSDCTGGAAATGTAAAFGGAGLTVTVPDDSTTTLKSTATDAAGNASPCSAGFTYVEASVPAPPSGLAASPASPANDNDPEITGSAEAGTTVRIYTTSDCSGAAAATGTAADFASPGLTVNVANDSTTTFKATATSAGGTSACSTGVAYVEDSTAPAAPSALATSPASPANDNDPEVTGSAEAGSTVRLYSTSDCSGAPLATGTAATFGGAGISVNVANDSASTYKATARDAAGNTSACSSGVAYVEDSTAPSAPTIDASSPASPANDNDPELTGSAEAGSTVRLYTTNDCSGAAVATGTAATFGGAGLSVNVGNDSTTSFHGTATDAAGNASGCSVTPLSYMEDSTAPSAPSALATSPASPSNDNDPEVTGSAEAASTVRLYSTSDCSGAPLATDTAAAFGGAGITANVSADSTTTLKATARDAAGNTSACSAGVAYVEDSTAPAAPSALDSSPASPANENDPEVTGTAEAGSTVRLYTTNDCSGAPLATGAAGTFATPGFSVNVADDSTTTYKATATDAAGNASSCSAGFAYVEDSTAPAAPSALATSPASPANENDPEVTGGAEAGSTVRLYTTNDCSGAALATGTAATFGGAGISVNVANDSSSTFKATARDAAGNVSSCSTGVAYLEDSTAPAAPSALATSPASPANENDPEVTGTAEAGSTVRLFTTNDCSGAPLASASAASFASPGITRTVANDASTTWYASATDAAGNVSPCSSGVAYVEDSTAPATPSALDSSPASPANENDPEITGSADAGTTVRLYTTTDCSGAPVATGAAASFAAPGLSVNVGNDSTTSFRATARDAAGNTSACSAALTYVEDSSTPAAPSSLGTSPASPANDNDPEVTGTAETGTTVRVYTTNDCSGAPTATGSSATFGGAGLSVNVANGSTTTFKATATDAAGNTSACSTGVAYVEDSTDPTSAVSFPVAAATYTTATWADFAGTASDAAGSGLQRVELSIRRDSNGQYWNGSSFGSGSEDWRTATSTASWSYAFAVSNFPADGDYTVRVRAFDNAGNVEPASSRTFTVDRGAPNTTIDSSPDDPSNDPNPSFAFSASEGGVTFECQIDGLGWSSCTSPKSYSGLTEASHTFEVRATDGAGNTDPTPASQTWLIDLTGPSSAFTFPAAGGSYNTAGWNDVAGTASDTGGAGLLRVEVSVRRVSTGTYWDGGAFGGGSEQWHTASGTGTWTLAFPAANFPSDGDYAVRVRAVDDAGNTQTPVSRSFTVDTVAPETTIDSGPTGPTADDDADFAFSADQPGATFQCRIDSGSWGPCTSPKSYTGLAQGAHTFEVRATDPGSNTDATPATRSWTVDTVPPTATMDNPGAYLRGTVNLTSTTGDVGGTGIASTAYEKSPAGAGTWTPVAATWDTTSGADGLYDLRVVATDNAGNTTTSAAVTNVRVDNTAPSATMDNPGAAVSGTVALSSTNDDGSGSGIDTVQFQYKPSSGSTWDDTAASWDTTLLTDGDYDLRAIVTDRAGNSTTSAVVTTNVDNVNPTISFATPLAGGFVNAAAADPFTLVANASDAGSGVASVEFWVCDDTSASCSSNNWTSLGTDATAAYEASWALPGTDGNRALRARATDNAGRQETAVIDVTLDRVVPETTLLTNPGNPSADATPSFTFESDEAGALFECSVDGGAWTSCATPHTTIPLADGTRTFDVRATDLAGNTDATSASWTWLVDTTAPVATMDDPGANLRGTVGLSSSQSDPGGAASSGIATIVYQYSVADANTWVPVAAVPWDTTVPNDGLYDVRVVVTDNAGNETQSVPVEDRRIDNSPPVTAIDDPGANLRSTVTLTGSASDSGSGVAQVSFEYSVDGSSWTPLPGATDNSAPYEFAFDTTSLPDGLYFFRTTASDVAGNAAVGAAVGPNRIDNTAPIAVMNDPGANLRGTVNLTSTADDPGGSGVATVVYGYTGPESGTTASTWATNGVADGVYDLTVTVTDVAGNVTVSNVVSGRRVDNTEPSTGHNAPGGWQSSGVTVTLSPSDGGSGVTNTQYAVDGGGWQSGTSVSVAGDGIHSISFFSTDAAGNIESPKTATVSIDTTPPSAGAMDPGNYLRGTVTLNASPDGGGPGAALVGVEFQHKRSSDSTWTSLGIDTDSPYSASWVTSPADDGDWDLRFIARDDATPPNEDTVDMNSKIVDNTAPTGSVASPLAGATVSGDVTLGVTANDANPIASVEYYVNGGSVGSASGTPYQVTWSSGSTSDGPKSIHAVITDMAGNSHTTAAVSVTSDNFAPTVSVTGLPAYVSGAVTLQASASSDTVTVAYQARQLPSGGWSGVGSSAGGSPWTVGWTPPTDGGWEVRAIATDAGANSGTSTPVQTFVDNTAPTGLLTEPSGGDTVGGSAVVLEATASDGGSGVASVAWQARQSGGGAFGTIASDSSAPFAATWDVTSLPSASHDVQIVVTDAAGNTFTSPFNTIDVDSTAPTVTLNDPGAMVSGTIALSAATAGDAATVTFAISPAGAASWTTIATDGAPPYGTNFDTTTQGDGVYDLRAVVSDSVGNTSTHVRPGVRIDNFMPVLVSSAPSNGSIVASASSVVLNFSEAGTVSALELDGSAAPCVAPCSGTSVTLNSGPLANGSHTVTGTVTDGAGNASAFALSFVIGVPAASEEPSLPVDALGVVPVPTNFRGTIDADGTLTLAWTPAESVDGTPLATILYIDGFATQSMAPGEGEVNLGPFDAADLRTFAVAAVGLDGRAGATGVRLRSTSLLAGKPLADAEAALVNRGFALGDVTGAGQVVVKPERPLMAALGSPVDLELGQPSAPQTRLAFNVVGTRRYTPPAQKTIGIRAKVTRAAQVTATLLSPKGQRVYRWRFRVKAGTSVLRLTMPPTLRRVGLYRLVFTVESGRDTVKRTLTLEVVGKGGPRTRKKPLEVVLAGSSGAKDDIAVDLAEGGLRLLAAAGTDEAFGITGSATRNVEVVVVDVDRFGVGLVRDLRIVFPMVKIIALSNDPRRIAQAMRAGATIAVAGSTPPKELARLITQIAKRR